jgi:hypothetical protein
MMRSLIRRVSTGADKAPGRAACPLQRPFLADPEVGLTRRGADRLAPETAPPRTNQAFRCRKRTFQGAALIVWVPKQPRREQINPAQIKFIFYIYFQ